MTKRIRRKWFVYNPDLDCYLGPNGTWREDDKCSLSERQIKAINPDYWDWREEDKGYVLDECNKQERKRLDGWR